MSFDRILSTNMDSKEFPKSKLCNNFYAKRAAVNIKRKLLRLEQNIFIQSLSRTAVLFGQNTTLHGVNHIVDDIQQLRNTQSMRFFSKSKRNFLFLSNNFYI